jgi:LCP family protein required for cell wall assembly
MLGEGSKLPGGGPALAAKTVEALLGVPIHYYAQIDFSAFITFIDAIGGIKIEVTEPIKIDMLGDSPIITNKKQGKQNKGDRTVKVIKPGKYNFSGEMALAYARQRYTQGGDFDRAQRHSRCHGN